MVTLSVKPTDEGFLCKEKVGQYERIVKSKEEFLKWCEKIPDNWDFGDISLDYEELRGYYNEEIKEKAEVAWDWMEIEMEDY